MKSHQKVRREGGALVARKSNPLRRRSEKWRKALAWAVTAWTLGMAPTAFAHPIPDAAGADVSIVTNGNVMNITGAAYNLIKWVDFSIKSGETVAFDANNYLNYVTGSARSDILGTLTGGGHIYLVNPNGILIGDSAVINVGNLHLSTRTLSDEVLNNFAASTSATPPNPLTDGAIGGDVINMGNLNATSISVEGNNITFKSVADVALKNNAPAGSKINVNADGEIRVGFAVGETPATAVNDTQYKNVAAPDLTGWSFNNGAKTPVQYMLVRNANELQNIQNNNSSASGFYMLASDVDMSTLNNFTPIKNFFGKFDGLNHQIQNLTVNMGNADDAGLFGIIKSSGVVENVGLVGGSVSGQRYVGGIAGENFGTIRNVYNTGSVTGTSYVGGIVGNNTGTVERAYNTGSVDGQANYVGGVVGQNTGTVERAYNTGDVTGENSNMVGGIAGDNTGTVECAYNTGDVTGENSNMVGGIAGNNTGTISKAFNAGTVSSESRHVGGIAGFMNSTIINAYNTGDVTGHHKVGGIVGEMEGNVTNVYNTGSVTATGKDSGGDAYVGGLVGYKPKGILTNAYTKSGMVSAPVGANHVDDRIGNRDQLFISTPEGIIPAYAGVTINNKDALKKDALKQAATFEGFDFSESGPWRIYEDKTTPFLAAFPIPEPADPPNPGTDPTNPGTTDPVNPDPVTPDPVNPDPVNPDPVNPDPVNPDPTNPGTDPTNPGTDPTNPGTTDPTNPGTTDPSNPGTTNPSNPGTTDPTNPGTTDPINPLNPTNPASAGDPTPQPEQKPQDIVKNVTENRGAAQEYTNVVGSINSGASTAMPTSGGTPVLNAPEAPTQNAAPTTGATGETQGAAAQKQSGGEAQQPNENPPQQQTTGGQIAAGKQETQLGITYTDINMPESMSVEALATSLNGGTTATTPNNAGGEATQNGPATEPTATTGGNMSGANEEDEA